jgi:multidrug efflux system membrane fusion protein
MVMLGAVGLVALAGGLAAWHGREAAAAPEAGNANAGQAQHGEQNAVPVFAAQAKAEDVPIILRGIGAVQAFNTVSVKSRVEGNITQVAYKEGQDVKAGDLLVQIDPRPYQAALDQATANQEKDQATLANDQLNLKRDAAIVGNNLAVTQQQYDNQKAKVASDQATVDADKAQVESAKVNLDYTSIRSPITGRTGRRQIDIGNLVEANGSTPLVVVTQMKPIYVTFSLPGSDLTRIREEMAKHELTVAAFNVDDNKQIAEGALTLIDNQVDQTTGMVTLKATYANGDEILWPGAFVNAHLVLNTVKDGVTVPSAAVQMGPAGAFVYVVQDNSTVKAIPVTVTQVERNTALIGKGLNANDKVVVSGQNGLYPDAKVAMQDGAPGQMNAKEPEIGPEGVGSAGINTPTPGAGGAVNPR